MEKILIQSLVFRKIIDRLQKFFIAVFLGTILLLSINLLTLISWTLFNVLICLGVSACACLLALIYLETCWKKEVNPNELIYDFIEELENLKKAKAATTKKQRFDLVV